MIWRVNTTTLQVRLFAGAVGQPGLEDGQGTAARFNKPDLVVSADGQLITVADQQNTAVRLIERDGRAALSARELIVHDSLAARPRETPVSHHISLLFRTMVEASVPLPL